MMSHKWLLAQRRVFFLAYRWDHDGIGVEKDLTKAFRWFQSSAEKGNILAMYMVGCSYEAGTGVEGTR